MTVHDRLRDAATRLVGIGADDIDGNSTNNVILVTKGDNEPTNNDEPWNGEFNPANEVRTAVKFVFFPDILEDRQLTKYVKGSVVVDGQVDGFFPYREDVTPQSTDIIYRPKETVTIDLDATDLDALTDAQLFTDFDAYVIKNINPIRPSRKTIMYTIEFGR